jgi:hypothetical protein
VPKKVKLSAFFSTAELIMSIGSYDAGGQSYIAIISPTSQDTESGSDAAIKIPTTNALADYQKGVVSVDATNITITWTKVNTPTGTAIIHWEAEG